MKSAQYLILFFSFLFTDVLYSQNEIYQNIKKLPISVSQKISKIDSLLDDNLKNNKLADLEVVSRKYSNWLYKKGYFRKSFTYISKSIKYHSGDSLSLQKKVYNAGHFSYKAKDYKQSVRLFDQVVAINSNSKLGIAAYIELGKNHSFLGDLHLAIQYFETAESLTKQQGNIAEQCRGYINSFNTYRDLNTSESLDRLLTNLSTADSLIEVTPLFWKTKSDIKRCLGKYYYINKKKVDSINGLDAFQEAMDFALEANDSISIAGLYGEMGVLFNTTNLDKSTRFLEQALQYYPANNQKNLEVIYSNLGRNQAKQGNFDTAIKNQKKALQLVLKTTEDVEELTLNERGKLWEEHSTDDYLWDISSFIAETYLLQYEKTKNPKTLQKSIEYFKITDEIFNYFTNSVDELNSKLQWRKYATQHYGRALKACLYANDTDNALYFMEKNKAIILTEKIEQQRTNRAYNLPEEVYAKERKLQHEILTMEELTTTQSDPTETWQTILRTKQTLSSHWDSIHKIYPTTIPDRKITLLSKNEIQKTLSSDEVIVEFHLAVDDEMGIYSNSTNGYVLVLEKEAAYLAEIPNIQDLKGDILLLTESLKTPFSTQESPVTFNELSHRIYLKLFPTETIRNSLKSKKVTIVPDNYLSLLPFEALTTDANDLRYLLQDCELRYLYSRSFLENNRMTSESDSDFLGMAPVNFNDSSLTTLSQSEGELEVIHEFYSGDILLKSAATKSAFLERLNKYRIIHLATHADAQDATAPWIAFYDEKITLEELYQTQNNASLVVLSGCNTTLGKQEIGEGVMSLARGFFYSGAQSVMSTLWSIDDKSTATITQSFYKNLEEGQTKSEALRNAKLNYLDNHSLSEASPYHWASFIVVGDNAPIKASQSLWPFLPIGVIALLLFLVYRFRRKVKN